MVESCRAHPSLVRRFSPGDRVGVDPNLPCHCCQFCVRGQYDTRVVKTCHDVTCPGQVHFCQYGGARDASGVFRDGGAAELCLVQAEQVRGGGKTTSPLPGHCAGVPAAGRREAGHRGAVRAPLLHPARLGQAQVDIRTLKIFLTIFYPRSVSPIQPDSKVLVTGAGNHVYLLVPQID